MTAHAFRANLADRAPHDRRHVATSRVAERGRRREPWTLLAIVLTACGAAIGQEPGAIEDVTVPPPVLEGAFDSTEDGFSSVLVDDGGLADTADAPARTFADGVERAASGGIGGTLSCVVDPPAADPLGGLGGTVPWGSAGVDAGLGRCQPGMHGGQCQECWQNGFAAADAACSFCGDTCHDGCPPGCLWAVQVDALVLWRNNIEGQPLLSTDEGMVALDAGDAQTAAAAGPRIGVLRSLGCGRAIEATYFNVGGIQGTTATDGRGAPYTPIRLADIAFADIDSAEYTTRGQIKSAEVNYRWCQGQRVIWLAGFRWVEWNETGTVDMQAVGDEVLPNDIETTTGNDLYGGQIGCRLKFWDLGKWQVGAVGKAGVFGNTAYQRTSVVVDGEPFGPVSATGSDVAFFGEVGLNSTLWLNRWLAWRLGYNFFWLQGVATAAEQFPLANFGSETASINIGDAVFLQGVSTGLEARW
jgi:hypothetical protein